MEGVIPAVSAPALTLLSTGIILKLSKKERPPHPEGPEGYKLFDLAKKAQESGNSSLEIDRQPRSRPMAVYPIPKDREAESRFEYDEIDGALQSYQRGGIVLLVDDEFVPGENAPKEGWGGSSEGCLVVSADGVWAEQMAWMIKYTSGFINIALPTETLEDLELPLQPSEPSMPAPIDRKGKAKAGAVPSQGKGGSSKKATKKDDSVPEYAIGIDYKHDTSTGISAHDRALTARALAHPDTVPEHFTRPGHLVPVLARPLRSHPFQPPSTSRGRSTNQKTTRPPIHPMTTFASASLALCDLTSHEPGAVLGILVSWDDEGSGRVLCQRRPDPAVDSEGKGECRGFADRWGLKCVSVGMVRERMRAEKGKGKATGGG